jgi:crotonobetainyl-CoA:carnitine CoA-transferase CaiB-like acyl-CoA transferase
MPGPLHGVKVLEVAQVYAVPAAGTLLADMGASVTKVEPPWGDSTRYGRPFFPGEGKNFIGLNHGKRTICLDLALPEARSVIYRLVGSTDVVLISLRADQVERYGLQYERCAALNAGLIYAINTALGPDGPLGGLGGYDMTISALSGIGSVMGHMRDGQLVGGAGVAISDAATSFLLTAAVASALYHRLQTGAGQRIETSNLSSALNCQLQSLNWFAASDPPLIERFEQQLAELRALGADFSAMQAARARVLGRAAGANIYYRYFRTRDGYISVGAISPDLARRYRAATGIEDPRQRPGWDADSPADRRLLDDLTGQAEEVFRSRSTDEWVAAFTAHRVPHGRVNFPEETLEDPQVLANGYIAELEHPLVGTYRTPAPPIRMSATPLAIASPAAALDQHTDEVLQELGFTAAEIERLRAAGAAGRATELKSDFH